MKKKNLLLITLLLSCITGRADVTADNINGRYVDTLAAIHPEYLPNIPLGAVAPEISAPDTLGNIVNLSDFKGKYVVVDFWATWCGDCRHEMPGFKKLYDELNGSKLKDADIQFLSYSFDRDSARWKEFICKERLSWPQISTLQPKWHDIPVTQAYGINWIPAFLLISPDGKVVGKAITAEGLRKLISDECAR